jgi:hypothetical protein
MGYPLVRRSFPFQTVVSTCCDFTLTIYLFFVIVVWGRVSLCCPGWFWTVDHPAHTSWVLGLRVCTTIPSWLYTSFAVWFWHWWRRGLAQGKEQWRERTIKADRVDVCSGQISAAIAGYTQDARRDLSATDGHRWYKDCLSPGCRSWARWHHGSGDSNPSRDAPIPSKIHKVRDGRCRQHQPQ